MYLNHLKRKQASEPANIYFRYHPQISSVNKERKMFYKRKIEIFLSHLTLRDILTR